MLLQIRRRKLIRLTPNMLMLTRKLESSRKISNQIGNRRTVLGSLKPSRFGETSSPVRYLMMFRLTGFTAGNFHQAPLPDHQDALLRFALTYRSLAHTGSEYRSRIGRQKHALRKPCSRTLPGLRRRAPLRLRGPLEVGVAPGPRPGRPEAKRGQGMYRPGHAALVATVKSGRIKAAVRN